MAAAVRSSASMSSRKRESNASPKRWAMLDAGCVCALLLPGQASVHASFEDTPYNGAGEGGHGHNTARPIRTQPTIGSQAARVALPVTEPVGGRRTHAGDSSLKKTSWNIHNSTRVGKKRKRFYCHRPLQTRGIRHNLVPGVQAHRAANREHRGDLCAGTGQALSIKLPYKRRRPHRAPACSAERQQSRRTVSQRDEKKRFGTHYLSERSRFGWKW